MEEKGEKEEKKLSDILKRVVNTGISAAFMTEDALRNVLHDLPLPKEIVQGLLQNAKESKNDFIQSVKNELKSYLNQIDLSKEIDHVLDQYDFEFTTKVKVTKKNSSKKSK